MASDASQSDGKGVVMTDNESLTSDAILQLGLGFWGFKTLLSAVELGLFSALAERPLAAETLRKRLGLHKRSAADFFDALVALGMLQRQECTYANTPATGLFLDRSKPTYIGGFLEMANARLYPFWGSLTEGLKTGQPQNEAKTGGSFFDALYQDPDRLKQFAQGMTGLSMGSSHAVAQSFPWREFGTFVDIGCAQGGLPVTLARAHPHLRGGGFDLPPLQPIFEDYVGTSGLADRLQFYPGDFFVDPLPSADVLIMGHILHDWDLVEKKELLSRARGALPDGGALIVYDTIIDDGRCQNGFGLLMNLNMLIETPGGFDYTGAECSNWMREAGFHETRVAHLAGVESMVIGIR